MAEPPLKPILQKPPGYNDPNSAARPARRPPARKPILPSPLKQKKQHRRGCCRSCCCFLCIFILILIVVIGAAAGFLYLWFEPKLPAFHLQSFRISQLNVTDKTDGTYLDAKTISRIEVRNPNAKLSLHYGDMEIEVTAGEGIELGLKTVPGFIQATENTVSLKVETGVSSQSVDGGSGRKLNSGHRSKELVVNVVARTKVGLVVDDRKMKPVKIKVVCGGVSLKSLERGDMPKCSVHLRKWFL